MSKRVDAPYRSGPHSGWIKVRNPESVAVQRERSENGRGDIRVAAGERTTSSALSKLSQIDHMQSRGRWDNFRLYRGSCTNGRPIPRNYSGFPPTDSGIGGAGCGNVGEEGVGQAAAVVEGDAPVDGRAFYQRAGVGADMFHTDTIQPRATPLL